ncbi:MAG TPA: D-alanine--D-alanine ligase [Solirubrobacteraceae bacterium]|nr:D-alanine--D-alanine ligase [Solirubrobacteraceae bacterium]
MSPPRTIAVLKGGRSLERQVSLASGGRVEHALERLGHAVAGIDVGPDLVTRLRDARPDAVFIALHGRDGEDGTVQELLEALGLPYTGPRPAGCAFARDKVLAKHLMLGAGIPTPDFLVFSDTTLKEMGAADALPGIGERLDFPVVVKPARSGSALGVRFAASPEEVPAALLAALSYDDKVLVERYVHGRELAVSVLGGEALPVVEAVPHDEDFYDFEARYTIGRTSFHCPAELGDEQTARALELAVRVAQLLGLTDGSPRVDLLLEEGSGALHVLEANAIPGMTETSLTPQAAEAAGIGFDELIARVLERAR